MAQIPVLGEHQSQEVNTTNPVGYTPTPEEKKALKLVNRLFEKAKSHRKKFDGAWLDYYKLFRGKQWKEQRPSYRHSEVINFIFQTIQTHVPILADARQRFEFLAQEPSDTEFAKIMDEVAESDWQSGNWTYKLAETLYDGHLYGTGLSCVDYDAKAKFGMGAVDFSAPDPFYCFPDPNATDVNDRKSKFFIYAEPTDLELLKAEYPDKAKFIKPDLIDLMGGSKSDLNEVRYKSPVDNMSIIEGQRADEFGKKDQALKITCYLHSDEIDEEEKPVTDEAGAQVLDEQGQPKVEYLQKKRYPNGRKICIAGGVVLSDGPMEFDDGLFPYAKFANYIDPRSFWGIAEAEQLEGPQKIFNKVFSYVLDVLTLMGNPIWVVDTTSGIDTDHLVNRPGLVVEKEPGTEARREAGVQLQPYVLQILDRVREYIDSVAGSNDVTRGVRPDGITAASAISSLQEAAQTRIRQKSRNLDALLQNAGQLYKNRVLQFYTAPRVIRVTGNDQASRYFKFHIEHQELPDGSTQKVAKVRNYIQNPETGSFSEDINQREYVIRGDFDVRVTTGSALPFAKDQKFSQARQMFLDGVIDAEEYLKAADYPNWQAVLQRVEEKKMQEAQMAMAMQGGGQGAPAETA
jgi:hypothetical protein